MAFVTFDSDDIFNMTAVVRDSYKKALKDADARRTRALEKAQKFSNDAGYALAKKEADADYEKAVEKARFAVETEFFDALDSARAKEVKRVQTIPETKLSKIKLLSDRKMSAEELHALAKIDGFALDYWCSQYLRDVADISGLVLEDLPDVHVLPSLSTKLRVIDEIMSETEDMLKNYNPKEDSLKDFAYLHDAHITKWTERFTNGLRTLASLSDEAIIRRSFSKINEGMNEFERGQAIKSALDECPDKCRAALLTKIAESHVIGDVALKLSGYADEIKSFRDGNGTAEYQKALEAVQTIKGANSIWDETALQTIHDMRGNRYFMGELQKSAVDSEVARHYYEVAEEQAAEGAEH